MSLYCSDLEGGVETRAPAPTTTRLEALCEGVIEAGWLAVLVTVPLHFDPFSRQSFEPDKSALLRLLVLLMAAAWVVKVAAGGRLMAPRSASDRAPQPVDAEDGGRRWWRIPLLLPSASLALVLLASAWASIDRTISFTGSYARAQGVWTQLSYVALFALVLAHLRAAWQWRRIVYAIVLTSFAVSSYAVLQRLGLDPVSWAEREDMERVGSTLGNPIFLAAFLLFVVFVTARELFAGLARIARIRRPAWSGDDARARGADLPTLAILVYNLVLLALAIVFAQSRGPVLGLLAGAFVAGLALLLDRRERASASALRTRLRRHAWLLLIAGALGLLAVFGSASQPGTKASKLAELPYVGRLATPFNLTAGTARVRILVWGGGVDLLRDLVRTAAGAERPRPARVDPLTLGGHAWLKPSAALGRLLLGHGPDTFRLAYSPFHPSEIAGLDDPDAVPDRGHNEVLDRLISTGVLGFAVWFWWYGALLLTALRGVVSPAAASSRRYWTLVIGGALTGMVAAVASGLPELAFFGIPAGMLGGAVWFLTVAARRGSGQQAGPRTPYQTLSIALLATVTAHLVESNLGIAVTPTSVYLWFLAAVLVAAERRWLELESTEADAHRDPSPVRSAAIAGLIAALVASTLVFTLLGNPTDASSPSALLVAALTGAGGIVAGALWLPFLSWTAAAALAGSLERRAPGRPTAAWVFGLTSLATTGAYLVYHASRLSSATRMRAAGRSLPDLIDHIAHHAAANALLVLCWTLLAGAALGVERRRPGREETLGTKLRWRAAAAVLIVAAALAPAVTAVLRRSIVDSMVKVASPFASAGVDAGLVVLRRAVSLEPREATFELELGRSLVDAARRTESQEDRARWLVEARTALETARSLAPLDPDHSANLARLAAIEADYAPDDASRRERLDAAAEQFVAALALRPPWVRLLVEYAVLEYRRGRSEQAFRLIGHASGLDRLDPLVYRALADLHLAEAARARLAGNKSRELLHQRSAEAAETRILEIERRQLMQEKIRLGGRPPR